MSLFHFRYKERRRTVRVSLNVPLTVHGKKVSGEQFSVQTCSQSINQQGGLFTLEEIVLVGDSLILVNHCTAQSADCRVVSIRRSSDGKQLIGVEFIVPENNFWHMCFPSPGTKPLRRAIPAQKALESEISAVGSISIASNGT